jgi:pyrroline-5-carboxylate reductase
VKPQVFAASIEDTSPLIGPDTLVVSVMAGVLLKQLAASCQSTRVVRAMPNTPGAIGQGVTVITAPPGAGPADIDLATELLLPLGVVEGPIDQNSSRQPQPCRVAARPMSSCWPKSWRWRARPKACRQTCPLGLARRTVEGAAALMACSDEAPDALRKAVTSPNGVTKAALDILMDEGGMPVLMRKALRAAANRERGLSRQKD